MFRLWVYTYAYTYTYTYTYTYIDAHNTHIHNNTYPTRGWAHLTSTALVTGSIHTMAGNRAFDLYVHT